jgi:hypothetical protein
MCYPLIRRKLTCCIWIRVHMYLLHKTWLMWCIQITVNVYPFLLIQFLLATELLKIWYTCLFVCILDVFTSITKLNVTVNKQKKKKKSTLNSNRKWRKHFCHLGKCLHWLYSLFCVSSFHGEFLVWILHNTSVLRSAPIRHGVLQRNGMQVELPGMQWVVDKNFTCQRWFIISTTVVDLWS